MDSPQVFDVIVVGGGNAGVEAAHAAAKLGSRTLLVTMDIAKIASMPCNPSIGGLGKGHIVYEISALGGLMPKIASQSHLQARMLNTSKGPAVQGLRLQIDKYVYAQKAQEALAQVKNLTILGARVKGLLLKESDGQKVVGGITLDDGTQYESLAVIITAGTFLNSIVRIGDKSRVSGPIGLEASVDLASSLADVLGAEMGRLKTGTPPRLLRESLDFDKMEYQKSDELDYLYEFDPVPSEEKKACYITHTNATTHQVIKDNLHLSAMYHSVKGTGPRYCPSIEDKVGRFPGRDAHHIFVEPESGTCNEVYPAGISTSMPIEIQEKYIRSIKGFEKAILTQPGYVIEYDFLQPNNLHYTLEVKKLGGLYCAGQINGTTGYEEAAGQGLIAGINAHQKIAGKEPFVLDRTESYIGVMLDDIITLGVDEPYRMFTSRAERRLLLRQDNVFARLMPYGHKLGLIDDAMFQKFLAEEVLVKQSLKLIKKDKASGRTLFDAFHAYQFGAAEREHAQELLASVLDVKKDLLNARLLTRVYAEVRYEGYLNKELKEVEKLHKNKKIRIPQEFVYKTVPGLSFELTQKLERHRPQSLADAELIPGMTPAALSLLLFRLREREKGRS